MREHSCFVDTNDKMSPLVYYINTLRCKMAGDTGAIIATFFRQIARCMCIEQLKIIGVTSQRQKSLACIEPYSSKVERRKFPVVPRVSLFIVLCFPFLHLEHTLSFVMRFSGGLTVCCNFLFFSSPLCPLVLTPVYRSFFHRNYRSANRERTPSPSLSHSLSPSCHRVTLLADCSFTADANTVI